MAADNREFVNKFANEGGGDVYAEDKRFEELKSATAKTGSQISTLAQYIPLQDTDGNLVKINPQSFQEAVRNVLGSLLANNDKGTTISGIPALSGSGANLDFGSISPANLASVLGATTKSIIPSTDSDFDNTLNSKGIYHFAGYQGTVFANNSFGLLFVLGDTYCAQILFNMIDNKIYYRRNVGDGFSQWLSVVVL